MSEIPLEIALHAERLYDDGGYESVPSIIAKAIMAERQRCASWHDHCAEQFASIDETYAAWHRASAAALRGTS